MMSCDFDGTTKENEEKIRRGKKCSRGHAWPLSSTIVNHKSDDLSNLCLFEASDQVSIVSSRTQGRIELCVPSWHDATNSVGGYSFVCAIISECIAFSPLYIRDHLRPRSETRVHLHRRGYYCFVDLFIFPFILYILFFLLERGMWGSYKNL